MPLTFIGHLSRSDSLMPGNDFLSQEFGVYGQEHGQFGIHKRIQKYYPMRKISQIAGKLN